MGTESCPEPRRQPTSRDLDAVIPIAGFMIIDAGTASSSPFQHTPKIVHHHAGIVFTFIWNPRSRCAGNREHDRPEYAAYAAAVARHPNQHEKGVYATAVFSG